MVDPRTEPWGQVWLTTDPVASDSIVPMDAAERLAKGLGGSEEEITVRVVDGAVTHRRIVAGPDEAIVGWHCHGDIEVLHVVACGSVTLQRLDYDEKSVPRRDANGKLIKTQETVVCGEGILAGRGHPYSMTAGPTGATLWYIHDPKSDEQVLETCVDSEAELKLEESES